MHGPLASRARSATVTLVALLLASCHVEEPFARVNHWDPKADVIKRLSGPDSTFSIGDRIVVTLTTDPPLPDDAVFAWTAPGSTNPDVWVFAAGDGEFTVAKAHAEYAIVSVGASFGRSQVSWQVYVGQKVASWQLRCPTGACDGAVLPVGGSTVVLTSLQDANGNALQKPWGLMARATVAPRDPAVLQVTRTAALDSLGRVGVRGLAPGATWLVVQADGVRDSVRFVVGP